MASTTTTKAIRLPDGKRSTIRLSDITWDAIDLLADLEGLTASQWCSRVIAASDPEENTTEAVRNAVIEAMLPPNRGQEIAVMEAHSLMRFSATLDDDGLAREMETATVQGKTDFTAFVVRFGHDRIGQDCIWIENQIRGGDHFAFVVPDVYRGVNPVGKPDLTGYEIESQTEDMTVRRLKKD